MTYYLQQIRKASRQIFVTLFAVWVSVAVPVVAVAQEVSPSPSPSASSSPSPEVVTGPTEPTGAPACTGAGCTQGLNQGFNQGLNQGGPTLQDLGAVENEEGQLVLPEGVQNTTQGAQQGVTQGITATNSETGADSENTATVDATTSQTSTVQNTVHDTTNATLGANTGGNSGSLNSSNTAVTTGDANIGVTQVKNDNTTTSGGNVGLSSSGHAGNYEGDLELDFANAMSLLTGEGGSRSIRAVNDMTGSGSTNDILLGTRYEDILEVQNDGVIDNDLTLDAITGQNDASMNTGGGQVDTGNANIAATLINLLNTTVLNGNLVLEVHDIFGDLLGDIRIPDLSQLAAVLGNRTTITADNEETGSESDNSIAVDIEDTETMNITNDADINTNITANAITGQNDATANTGGSQITTGDGSVQASNVSVANTTVEGGNWGLVVVNALNRWLGFLVGDNGETRALTQDETIREIEARNNQTGADSDNTITITDETNRETTIDNEAVINNNLTANAITGQNEAVKNTGAGVVTTGNANILANTINIANTTVKNANLGIAVVNVFGNWMGDLMYKGASLLAGAGGGAESSVDLAANNSTTGANSDNTIDVNIDRTHETNIENDADIDTVLNANIDTGNNTANKNTQKGQIDTGDSLLALHSRTVANVTGVAGPDSLDLQITGGNDTTGAESENRINATINDNRILNVDNEANVSTVFSGGANTGNNEASYNTGGGSVVTGDIVADVAMENLINQVMVATGGGGGLVLGTDLHNAFTGADSENTNNVEVARAFLSDIFNDATVDSLIDLLLNTGGNKVEQNTGGGSIVSGDVCVDGHITNDINSTSGLWAATRLMLQNWAGITNDTTIGATTGENILNMNTGGDEIDDREGLCDRLAQGPEKPEEEKPVDEEEKPGNGGGGEEEGGGNGDDNGGGVGGGGDEDLPILARVAGAKVAQAAEEKVAQVKGVGEQLAATGRSFFSRRQALWTLFVVGSGLVLAGAMKADRQQRQGEVVAALG